MKATTYFAQKDLVIDGQQIKAGSELLKVETAIPIEKALAAISKGAAQSWQMENRWQNMVNGKFDYGFAVDWMRKDLAIAMAEGKRAKAQMPLVALVDQFYARVQERGGGRWDTSSLIQPLQKP